MVQYNLKKKHGSRNPCINPPTQYLLFHHIYGRYSLKTAMSHSLSPMFTLTITPLLAPQPTSLPKLRSPNVPCPIWRPNVNLFASVFHHHQTPGLDQEHQDWRLGLHLSWVWVPLSRTVDWHNVVPWSVRTRGCDSPFRAGRARAWACGKGARWVRNARCWHLSCRLLRTLENGRRVTQGLLETNMKIFRKAKKQW